MMSVANRVEIAFGHTRQGGEAVPASLIDQATKLILSALSRQCGGATAFQTLGAYVLDSGELITEHSTTCVAMSIDPVDPTIFEAVASDVAGLLDQESVLLTVFNTVGQMEFVRAAQALSLAA